MDLNINGIPIIFPHKPYTIQVDYMRAVITALQKKENALLESPTGTGKTLSLLCSTLAWLDHQKYLSCNLDNVTEVPDDKNYSMINYDSGYGSANDKANLPSQKKNQGKGKGWKTETPIRIVYCSRTHSQLNQACAELKRSFYNFTHTITIGSREQLCINSDVTKLESNSAKNQSCKLKVKMNTCNFHKNYEQKMTDLSFDDGKVLDIEDLIKYGNQHKACPYYMARARSNSGTSLIFMPYNYVLDPSIRKTLKLNLANAVIIFDEGHNIERVCEESMSKELKSEWLATFINTFDTALQSLRLLDEGKYDGTNEKELSEMNMHDIAKIKIVICDLENELDTMIRNSPEGAKAYHKTNVIFQIFERLQLDYQKCGLICSVCDKLTSFVLSSSTSYMTNSIINSITSVCSFIEAVMPFTEVKSEDLNSYKADFVKNYRLYSEIEQENNSFQRNRMWNKKSVKDPWTLYLWCMSPSVAIKSLQSLGVHNLIITSGTLAPLESFECEMGIPFPIKLQNTHVISKDQLSIQLFFKDSTGYDLSGSFANRNDTKYYSGIGFTILELARTVPKGMFIFFSSYSLINKCIDMWRNRDGVNLWTSISSLKRVFIEPRGKNEFNTSLDAFKETVDATRDGAIFMGVSRGKLSEGMDLGDDYCRAVVIVGLPYPARYDPKVVLKQKYLDENNSRINGIRWYMLQMKRALNQSIGRVVRHKNDYGAIIICDSRFKQLTDGLPKWIQAFLASGNMMNTDFKTKLSDIQRFYALQLGSGFPAKQIVSSVKTEHKDFITATTSTSTGIKCANSALKPPSTTVRSTSNTLVQSTLDSMRFSSYFSKKSNNSSNGTVVKREASGDSGIFNSFSYSSGTAKKRKAMDN